jgi:drug/metabolite transporter (DMT)-like permease
MQEETRIKGILFAVITGLCWSVVTIALKVALIEAEPFTIVWFRFTLAFSILLGYFLIKNPKGLKILASPPPILLVAAFALSINYFGILEGVHYTTPTTAQLVIQFGPITLALSGFIIYKEKITQRQIIGFLIAVTGLALFYNRQAASIVLELNAFNKGIRWTLVAAITWTVYSVIQKKLVRTWHVHQLNLIVYGLPILLYLPLADFSLFATFSFYTWAILVFLGLNTLVAYTFLTLSLKYLEANKVSIILVMNPIITFVLMELLNYLNVSWMAAEQFTMLSILGGIFVITGAVLVVGVRRQRKIKKQATQ